MNYGKDDGAYLFIYFDRLCMTFVPRNVLWVFLWLLNQKFLLEVIFQSFFQDMFLTIEKYIPIYGLAEIQTGIQTFVA